jgi:hypothetical protein
VSHKHEQQRTARRKLKRGDKREEVGEDSIISSNPRGERDVNQDIEDRLEEESKFDRFILQADEGGDSSDHQADDEAFELHQNAQGLSMAARHSPKQYSVSDSEEEGDEGGMHNEHHHHLMEHYDSIDENAGAGAEEEEDPALLYGTFNQDAQGSDSSRQEEEDDVASNPMSGGGAYNHEDEAWEGYDNESSRAARAMKEGAGAGQEAAAHYAHRYESDSDGSNQASPPPSSSQRFYQGGVMINTSDEEEENKENTPCVSNTESAPLSKHPKLLVKPANESLLQIKRELQEKTKQIKSSLMENTPPVCGASSQ